MAINMTLWIGNGAVLKSFSQWHLKEFLKINNSWTELFNFQTSLLPLTGTSKKYTITYL